MTFRGVATPCLNGWTKGEPMIQLPNIVRVANATYSITTFTSEELETNDNHGHCIYHRTAIRVSTAQSDAMILDTLLHEIGHAVNHAAGLNDQSTEEDFVLRATPIWMCVWRDNPALLQLLNDYANGSIL